MFKNVRCTTGQQSAALHVVQIRVETDLPQGDYNPYVFESRNFAIEKSRALGQFLRQRLVVGRSAADRRGDVEIGQPEPVVAVVGGGLIGESRFVQHGIHELAGRVSG